MKLQIDLIYRHLADPGGLEALLEGRRDPVLGREGHDDSGGRRNGRSERRIFVMKGENEGSGGGKKKIASSFAVAAQKRTERADFLIPLLRLPSGRKSWQRRGGKPPRKPSVPSLFRRRRRPGQKEGMGKKSLRHSLVFTCP